MSRLRANIEATITSIETLSSLEQQISQIVQTQAAENDLPIGKAEKRV